MQLMPISVQMAKSIKHFFERRQRRMSGMPCLLKERGASHGNSEDAQNPAMCSAQTPLISLPSGGAQSIKCYYSSWLNTDKAEFADWQRVIVLAANDLQLFTTATT